MASLKAIVTGSRDSWIGNLDFSASDREELRNVRVKSNFGLEDIGTQAQRIMFEVVVDTDRSEF